MQHLEGQGARVLEAFVKAFSVPATLLVRAPGRLNLLGSHVDHQEGWVLPGAIDWHIWLALRPNRQKCLRLQALDLGVQAVIDLADLGPLRGRRGMRWSDYPAGVAWALGEAGFEVTGIDAVYGGDLPREVGVSSSAAVEVAFMMAWRALAGLDLDRERMARLGRRVENDYLGISSGVMDQFVSLHGSRDHLLLLDCRSLEYETLTFPADLRFLVADSGVRRQLGRSGYNDPMKDCAEATRRVREGGWDVRSLRDLGPEDVEPIRHLLTSGQADRVEHVVFECARVREGAEYLREGKMQAFGQLLNLSHASSRDLWRVSTPELDFLVESASAAQGCLGARLSGAGLGGCILALVRQGELDATRRSVESAFESRFGRTPATFSCRVDDGAEVLACE